MFINELLRIYLVSICITSFEIRNTSYWNYVTYFNLHLWQGKSDLKLEGALGRLILLPMSGFLIRFHNIFRTLKSLNRDIFASYTEKKFDRPRNKIQAIKTIRFNQQALFIYRLLRLIPKWSLQIEFTYPFNDYFCLTLQLWIHYSNILTRS